MRATVAYTAARILLFVAAAFLIYLAGARGLLLLGLALLLSGAASYVLLSRQRDAMAGSLSRRLTSLRSRLDDRPQAEGDGQAARCFNQPPMVCGPSTASTHSCLR